MACGDGADDGQAQPVRGARAVPGQDLRREAGAVVLDRHQQPLPVRRGRQHDLPAAVPERVVEQVVHGLTDPIRVDAGGQAVGRFHPEGHALGLRPRRVRAGRPAEQLGHVRLPPVERELAVLRPPQHEQVLRQPDQPVGLDGRVLESGPELLG